MYFKCNNCDGQGRIEGRRTCDVCMGSGTVAIYEKDETLRTHSLVVKTRPCQGRVRGAIPLGSAKNRKFHHDTKYSLAREAIKKELGLDKS